MKHMLEYIGKKNAEFGTRKIFGWLKDSSIDPKQRLALAPYMAHFVFSFMDVNRFILRDMDDSHELQQLVNIHTNEDSHHWPWYVEDLKRMGYDKQQSFTKTLLFLWGDHCIKSRMITYEMTAIAKQLTHKEKIILVEVIEKTGNVFLGCTADVCREAGEGKKFIYYGDHHLASETGHTMGTHNIEALLHELVLSEEEAAAGIKLIDTIYGLYHDFVDEMYEFASSNTYQDLLEAEAYSSSINTRMRKTAVPTSIQQAVN